MTSTHRFLELAQRLAKFDLFSILLALYDAKAISNLNSLQQKMVSVLVVWSIDNLFVC